MDAREVTGALTFDLHRGFFQQCSLPVFGFRDLVQHASEKVKVLLHNRLVQGAPLALDLGHCDVMGLGDLVLTDLER